MKQTVGFIGAGNIARSLMSGLINSQWQADQIMVSDPNTDQLARMTEKHPVMATTNNNELAQNCSVVVLAVKPQIMRRVCEDLEATFDKKKPLILSVAAGIRVQDIDRWLGGHFPIVRVMPNTPALLGHGASGVYANDEVSEHQRQTADLILSAVGITRWVTSETDMDAVTAVSGTGPAYFFLLMEALENAATRLGLEPEVARELIAQTAIGSAYMMRDSGRPPGLLRENVTSPGGTTVAAMEVFKENKVIQVIEQAVVAAHDRARDMADAFGQEK